MKLLYRRPVFLAWRISGHGRGISTLTISHLSANSRIRPSLSLSRGQWHPYPHRSIATNAATVNKTAPSESPSPEDEESTPSLSDQVRFLMRQVPHPVAIITATDPNSPADQAFRGMTVSSFNTVTLYPEPVISFNVKRPSETLHALQTSGHFHVHLLAPSEETAKLAREFSRGNNNLRISRGEGQFEFFLNLEKKAPPVLRRRKNEEQEKESQASLSVVDFPFILECRTHPQKIEVHDHTIVLGTVVRTLRHPDGNGDDPHSNENLCLTYADTRFWKMGEVI